MAADGHPFDQGGRTDYPDWRRSDHACDKTVVAARDPLPQGAPGYSCLPERHGALQRQITLVFDYLKTKKVVYNDMA
jgi:hypothetical protein